MDIGGYPAAMDNSNISNGSDDEAEHLANTDSDKWVRLRFCPGPHTGDTPKKNDTNDSYNETQPDTDLSSHNASYSPRSWTPTAVTTTTLLPLPRSQLL